MPTDFFAFAIFQYHCNDFVSFDPLLFREQMELGELVYSLRNPTNEEVNKKFAELYNGREEIVKKLETLNKRIYKELSPTGKKINDIIVKLVK